MKAKYFYFIFLIFIMFLIFSFYFSAPVFAVYPKLVTRLIKGFNNIKIWIIKISTPAAAVAVRDRHIYEKI